RTTSRRTKTSSLSRVPSRWTKTPPTKSPTRPRTKSQRRSSNGHLYRRIQGRPFLYLRPQPGAWGAMDYFLSAYKSKGGVNTGIYNCRSVRGGRTTSLHGEGRAADFGIRPYGARYGTALANALVAFSKELGIQCVIWNRKIWSSS